MFEKLEFPFIFHWFCKLFEELLISTLMEFLKKIKILEVERTFASEIDLENKDTKFTTVIISN